MCNGNCSSKDMVTGFQILDEVICISHCSNNIRKYINPAIQLLTLVKLDLISYHLTLVWQKVKEKVKL